jgi:hypothetical protein
MAISRQNIQTTYATIAPRLDGGNWIWFSGANAFDNTYLAIIRFHIVPTSAAYVGTVNVEIKNDDGTVAFTAQPGNNNPLTFTIPDSEEYKIGGAPQFRMSGSSTSEPTSIRVMFAFFNNSGDSIGIQS